MVEVHDASVYKSRAVFPYEKENKCFKLQNHSISIHSYKFLYGITK